MKTSHASLPTALPSNLWAFIWHFLKDYKLTVAAYITFGLLAGLWSPFNSIIIKGIIDSLTSIPTSNNDHYIWMYAFLLPLNFIVLDNITWRSIGYINYKYQAVIKNRIISETFAYVMSQSSKFFQDNLSGKVSSRINSLADNIENILCRRMENMLRGTSGLVVSLISMYFVHPVFCMIVMTWFVVFASYSLHMATRYTILCDAHTESESNVSGELVDVISNSNNVRMFASGDFELSRIAKRLLETKERFQDKELFMIQLFLVQGSLIAVMIGFLVYFLILFHQMHLVTIGDFALILGLGMQLAHITWYTMEQVTEFSGSVGKCKNSLAGLIVPIEIDDAEDAKSLQVDKSEIVFASVKFQYKKSKPLFDDLSVTISDCTKVGLVGYSGSGKSSFVNIILRFYEINQGAILIDGQDIRDVTLDSLHKNIAMIPQDPSLFHRSLMENIRYGRIDATDQEVIDAAKKAHAHDFIKKLPEGYDTLVGERGVKLSGGQRQRIAIARAILKNAPILILDEATSQLDSVTENDIQDSLAFLMKGKTTIVIAHRLSTLLHMDRILVFDKGRIVEDGTHEKLLTQTGLYQKLWNAQRLGFLGDSDIIPFSS